MENRIWRILGIILLCGICLSIGFLMGYSKGSYDGTKFAISVGMHFIEIDFNQEELLRLIERYKIHCGSGGTYVDCLDDIK